MRRRHSTFLPDTFILYFPFALRFYDQPPFAPLTANHTTSATNPEQRSADANNTTNVRRVASDRFSSVVTSTPEKPKTMTASATRSAPGKTMRHVPMPGRRERPAPARIAAIVTNNPHEKPLVSCTEPIPLWCFLFSIGLPTRTPACNPPH